MKLLGLSGHIFCFTKELFSCKRKYVSYECSDLTPTLLGQQSYGVGAALNMTLSDSMTNYKYLVFTMNNAGGNTLDNSGYFGGQNTAPILCITKVSYFQTNDITAVQQSSKGNAATLTFHYENPTYITWPSMANRNQTLYVYGLK